MNPDRPFRRDQGTVLVLAFLVITLTLVLVVDAAYIAQVEWEATRNADAGTQLEFALKGGYQIALALLVDDLQASQIDSLDEEWALPDGHERTLNPSSILEGEEAPEDENGDPTVPVIRIRIEDEDRKWPLNILKVNNEATQRRRLEGLIAVLDGFREESSMDLDSGTSRALAETIKEFIGREEGNAAFGPTPRPTTKTGGILSVADLALVPAIGPHLVFDVYDELNDRIAPGLIHFLTPWTDLAININTAPRSVLRGLFRYQPDETSVGDDIFAYRGEQLDELERQRPEGSRPPPSGSDPNEEEIPASGVYQSVEDIEGHPVTMTQRRFNETRTMMRVDSQVFSIWVEAKLGKQKRTRRWVVRREGARFVLILSEAVDYPVFREPVEDPDG